jgi:hypothetical protein
VCNFISPVLEEQWLKQLDNEVLRKIFVPEEEGGKGNLKK